MFIAISGASGSGKSTVMMHLMKRRKNLFLLRHATATTREKRAEDSIYQTYIYMTSEEFEKGVQDDIFIEYESVHGNFYGTLKQAFEKPIKDQENDYIKDIDVKGMLNVRKYLEGKVPMISIFLEVPDDELKRRLLARGESEERIKVRLERRELERSYKKHFDLVIYNINLEKTLQEIGDFIDRKRENNKK